VHGTRPQGGASTRPSGTGVSLKTAKQAQSDAWLKAQGVLSVKDLWCKAQGYTN
jgi:hypothetical protein